MFKSLKFMQCIQITFLKITTAESFVAFTNLFSVSKLLATNETNASLLVPTGNSLYLAYNIIKILIFHNLNGTWNDNNQY